MEFYQVLLSRLEEKEMLKDNLLILRNLHGYSQEEIAEVLNISRQAYAKWEQGATIPDVEKCSRLALFYGVSLDSLVKTEELEGMGAIPPGPKGKYIWGSVTVNERGQIVIPKAARAQFDLTGGQRLVVLGDDQGIALIPAQRFEASMRRAMDYAAIDGELP